MHETHQNALLKERVTFQTPVFLLLGIGYLQIPSVVFGGISLVKTEIYWLKEADRKKVKCVCGSPVSHTGLSSQPIMWAKWEVCLKNRSGHVLPIMPLAMS